MAGAGRVLTAGLLVRARGGGRLAQLLAAVTDWRPASVAQQDDIILVIIDVL